MKIHCLQYQTDQLTAPHSIRRTAETMVRHLGLRISSSWVSSTGPWTVRCFYQHQTVELTAPHSLGITDGKGDGSSLGALDIELEGCIDGSMDISLLTV